MKVVEILKLGKNWLEMLQKSCIKIEDLRFVDLYDEYHSIINEGYKKTYAIFHLSEKYKISERKIYYLIKKFSSDCNILAGI